jgi:hypothetical protein
LLVIYICMVVWLIIHNMVKFTLFLHQVRLGQIFLSKFRK